MLNRTVLCEQTGDEANALNFSQTFHLVPEGAGYYVYVTRHIPPYSLALSSLSRFRFFWMGLILHLGHYP